MDAAINRRRRLIFSLIFTGSALLLNVVNFHVRELIARRGRGRGHRRWWVRPVNLGRTDQGQYNNLLREIYLTDHEEFFSTVRMWPEHFDWLDSQISPLLLKTSIRESISPRQRLLITLVYLAQGGTVRSLHNAFRVGVSTCHKIISETCEALWTVLQPEFMPAPCRNDWLKIASEFYERWQMPNCIGAIDGRHMKIKAPPMSGSQDFNFKGFYSLVLLGVVGADYKFNYVDVGQYGSISDSGVWSNCELSHALEDGEANIPLDAPLPGTEIPFPYYFVGDEAFPSKSYLMRPYPGRNSGRLPLEERIFNYRLSRARRVSENAFGILVARWKILDSALSCSRTKAETIVKAIVCLHNMLTDCKGYMDGQGFIDIELEDGRIQEGAWRKEVVEAHFHRLGRTGANRAARIAVGMRSHLKEYLASPIGDQQVPWQREIVLRVTNWIQQRR